MPSIIRLLSIAPAFFAVAHSQGVLISAQGAKGSPASLGLQVDPTKSDANIINNAEIVSNVVNECGRTLLAGNIDIGENTENQLLNKTVTSVTKGSSVAVTIKQVDANGAGPYTCDMDLFGNADGATGQTNLTVTEKDAGDGTIALTVAMPKDMACLGSSAGNVCTVRCFNSNAAGPFGGCFAVQQTDITPSVNVASEITTAQTLAGVTAQIASNQKDLAAALKSNAEAADTTAQGVDAVDELLNIDSVAAATAGAADAAGTAAAATTTSAAKAASTSTGKKAGKGAAKGNANAATGDAATAKGNANAATAKGANANAATGNGATAKAAGAGKNNNNRRRARAFYV